MSPWVVFNATVLPLVPLVFAVLQLLRARRSLGWPQVEAAVIESTVRKGSGKGYEPRVVYAYAVDGKSYSGHRVAVGRRFFMTDEDWANRTAAKYPAGSRVVAWVDPADPSYAVLKPGVLAVHVVMAVCCSLFFVAGVGGALMMASATAIG